MLPRRSTILVVDDVPANILVLYEALGADNELTFATSGQEALSLAAEQKPDLILLDVMMPGLDGYEVCRRLKLNDDTRDIPVIFVTALGEEVDEMRGFACGGVDYLVKPIVVPIARARIQSHLELKFMRELLAQQAHLDCLTSLYNRRGFDAAAEKEWRRALRSKSSLAMMMIDVDMFKAYNDRYGHLAGDACLTSVAHALSDALRRPGDVVSRYGGEEFACIVSDADLGAATSLAEQTRRRVEGLKISHAGSPRGVVTVSLGIAACVPSADRTWRELLNAADTRLYEAKAAGRNSVSPSPGTP